MINIFDDKISEVMDIIKSSGEKTFNYNNNNCWPTEKKAPFLLQKETSIELGHHPSDSAAFLAVTDTKGFIGKNQISIVGNDITELSGINHSYGKIIIIESNNIDSKNTYEEIKKLEHIQYSIHLSGIMSRVSMGYARENIRIGTKAMENRVNFEKIGNTIINKFLKNDIVKCVKVIFICGPLDIYKEISKIYENVRERVIALNTIFDGIDLDCGTCNLSAICDEIEGLRELHKGMLR